jgi:hypothetical protein
MTRLEELDELQQYVFNKAPKLKREMQTAVSSTPPPPTSLLPGEMICDVPNELNGDAVLLDDVVVIHRDCGFLRQCSMHGWKTLYSAEQIAGTGKLQPIQVKVCTYNYWYVASFSCGCLLFVAILIRICEKTFIGMFSSSKKQRSAADQEDNRHENFIG